MLNGYTLFTYFLLYYTSFISQPL